MLFVIQDKELKKQPLTTYRQNCFTWNVTIPSAKTGVITNRSVLSIHSCDFSLELCNIFHSPERRSSNPLFPWKNVRGTVIFAGSKSLTLWENDMWRTGQTNIPSPSGPMLGSSWTLRPEARRNHKIILLYACLNVVSLTYLCSQKSVFACGFGSSRGICCLLLNSVFC